MLRREGGRPRRPPTVGSVHGGVALGGRERGVAEQLLDRPQVGPGPKQVGGEGVAQGVRRRAFGRPRRPRRLWTSLNLAGPQRSAAVGAEQRVLGGQVEGQEPQIGLDLFMDERQHRNEASLATLAVHPQRWRKRRVPPPQRQGLGNPQAAAQSRVSTAWSRAPRQAGRPHRRLLRSGPVPEPRTPGGAAPASPWDLARGR